MNNDIEYKMVKPDASLSEFVESFWMLTNHSENAREIIVLPDGRVDIIFAYSATEPFGASLVGLESQPSKMMFSPGSTMFAVSLKLLAVEYILDIDIPHLLNHGQHLLAGFWEITREDLSDFDTFCKKVSTRLGALRKDNVDPRKQKLFELIYTSKGSLTVKEMSEQVRWSSRQINRYFNQLFGLSLKAYCNILRFRASFQHIKEGKLFPEQNFTDQAHFIKEIKKFSGVLPKELSKNKDDRFIQFSTLTKK